MKTKLLFIIMALCLISGTAHANNPRLPYDLQKKYQKMFCVIAGIPINQCHRKPKK